MHVRRIMPLAALAAAVVAGHLTDQTTSQPLVGVTVSTGGAHPVKSVTNADGAFTLRGVAPGTYHVTVESDDVPPQQFQLTVGKAAKQTHDFVACSTTLDYHCTPGV